MAKILVMRICSTPSQSRRRLNLEDLEILIVGDGAGR
jgi:hypothetical protein